VDRQAILPSLRWTSPPAAARRLEVEHEDRVADQASNASASDWGTPDGLTGVDHQATLAM